MEDKEKEYIILHEKHHIHRMDYIVKALAFLAFCIHWFNPLVWAAFHFSTKDMEMSCDEAVIKKMGEEIRADYSASLLRIATGQRQVFGTPLAFGDGDVKGRIHNLAKWKKPGLIVTIGAVLVCVVAILLSLFGLDGSVDQGYTECWSKEDLLQVKDVNFDGNQDMEIFAWITNTSIPYYYMLWNGNSGQFEYGFCIQLTEVDYDKQQLVASYGGGAGTYYTDYYRYNENGELYLADRQIKDSEGNLINRQEQEWVEITEEEKLGNGQYLADMDWESLKTRITDTEYQTVQKYLTVLEGEDFTWIYRSEEGREPDTYTHDKRRISLEEWIRESYERNEQEPQKPVINNFVFADVFQSGKENIKEPAQVYYPKEE